MMKTAKETRDEHTLLELIAETLSKFPPEQDTDNARPFRLISVDYLEGKLTHPQFNMVYKADKTAAEMTDEILYILNARHPRMSAYSRPVDETPSHKWHLPRPRGIRRTATLTLEKGTLIEF
jgi:hypothetical protein